MQLELNALKMPGRLFGLAKGRGEDENKSLAFLFSISRHMLSLCMYERICVLRVLKENCISGRKKKCMFLGFVLSKLFSVLESLSGLKYSYVLKKFK